jgi:hypothetical protein
MPCKESLAQSRKQTERNFVLQNFNWICTHHDDQPVLNKLTLPISNTTTILDIQNKNLNPM